MIPGKRKKYDTRRLEEGKDTGLEIKKMKV